MAADDGLVMGLFPPAGISTPLATGSAPGDRGSPSASARW
jgi:hypothetical protein